MRRPTNSPDELRAFIAQEVEEIRNELEQLRSRVEAQQSRVTSFGPTDEPYERRAERDMNTR